MDVPAAQTRTWRTHLNKTGEDTYLGVSNCGETTNLVRALIVPSELDRIGDWTTSGREQDVDGGEEQGRGRGEKADGPSYTSPGTLMTWRTGIASPFAQVQQPTSECKGTEDCIRHLRLWCACKRL